MGSATIHSLYLPQLILTVLVGLLPMDTEPRLSRKSSMPHSERVSREGREPRMFDYEVSSCPTPLLAQKTPKGIKSPGPRPETYKKNHRRDPLTGKLTRADKAGPSPEGGPL